MLHTSGVLALVAGLVLVLVAGSGCESTEKKSGDMETVETAVSWSRDGLVQMKFDVDPSMLGIMCEDSALHLRFAPPRGWPPITPEELDRTRADLERLVPEGDRFHSKPVRIFCAQDRQLYLIVAEFHNWPTPVDPLPAMEDY